MLSFFEVKKITKHHVMKRCSLIGIYKLRAGKKKREGGNEGDALKSLMKNRGRTFRRKKREGESEGGRKKRPLFFSLK